MYAYCLFCMTQRCRVIARLMEIRGVDRAFSPRIEQRHRKQGENKKTTKDLLPGYVFLYSETRLKDYYSLCGGIDGVIRLVGKQDDGYELAGSDLDIAMRLLEKDGLVGPMTLCRVGDTVTLEDPLFNGCQGRVTEIDYRKERARVDFVFDRNNCHTWVSLDGVKGRTESGEEK